MRLGLDGTVDWVTLAGDGCCNNVCLVGDALIAHASSCGGLLSFLTSDGQVLRTHHIEELSVAFPNGQDGICARTSNSVRGFDMTGEQRWSVEVPNLSAASACGGVLYTVAGDTSLELSAFALP